MAKIKDFPSDDEIMSDYIYGREIKYNTNGAYGYPGYGHSTIIVNASGATIYIAYRTGANSNACNVKLKERYPIAARSASGSGGHLYRLISLKAPS